MLKLNQLRRQAVELRRLARMTADQSDAFVHVLHAIELEAQADQLEAGGVPKAGFAIGRKQGCNPE